MQGLQNLGSTCAINSLIQIICRTNKLRDILLEQDISENNAKLAFELKEILTLMHVNNNSLSPRKFINTLYNSLDGIFVRGEQIDIGELWTFLFDKIATELSIPFHYQESDNKFVNDCYNCISKFNNNKNCKWLESSQGILVNCTSCKNCNHNIYNYEPFTSISLDIINDNCPSIIDMLQDYLCLEERIADDWKCDNCKLNSNYTKTVKIWKIPDVLVLIIKRFSNIFQKNINPIKINKTLCFKKGSVFMEENDLQYNISGIGLHYGMLQGGHYNAICHIGNGTFLHYDDLDINNITTNDKDDIDKVISSNTSAYMVVYEKN